jgi:hypothetical protein
MNSAHAWELTGIWRVIELGVIESKTLLNDVSVDGSNRIESQACSRQLRDQAYDGTILARFSYLLDPTGPSSPVSVR